jgi:hypothetical protein
VASSLVGMWSEDCHKVRQANLDDWNILLLFENVDIFLCRFLKMRFLKQLL